MRVIASSSRCKRIWSSTTTGWWGASSQSVAMPEESRSMLSGWVEVVVVIVLDEISWAVAGETTTPSEARSAVLECMEADVPHALTASAISRTIRSSLTETPIVASEGWYGRPTGPCVDGRLTCINRSFTAISHCLQWSGGVLRWSLCQSVVEAGLGPRRLQ